MKNACDLWTAAFFMPFKVTNDFKMDDVPTTQTIRECLATNTVIGDLGGRGKCTFPQTSLLPLATRIPRCVSSGEFDIVLGNPPWDRIKLTEKEFFAVRDPNIAETAKKAEREKLIKELVTKNPTLAKEFDKAKHDSEAESKFVRFSERHKLTARGDINTYAIFAETTRCLLCPKGRVGIIVPSGIATDDTTSDFFADLVEKQSLVSLFDFEN